MSDTDRLRRLQEGQPVTDTDWFRRLQEGLILKLQGLGAYPPQVPSSEAEDKQLGMYGILFTHDAKLFCSRYNSKSPKAIVPASNLPEGETLRTELIQVTREREALKKEVVRLQEAQDNLLRYLHSQSGKSVPTEDLRLTDVHKGVVTEAHGDEIEVVYETDHGELSQVYNRAQFLEKNMPEIGDSIEVRVWLAVVEDPSEEDPDPESYEFKGFRDRGISGPIEI